MGYTLVFKLYRPSFLFRGCGKEADFREADKSVEAISFMLDRSLVIQPFIACVTIKELGLPRVRIAQGDSFVLIKRARAMWMTLALFFYFCPTTTAALRNALNFSGSSPIAKKKRRWARRLQ